VEELASLHEEATALLEQLTDEREVLKSVEGWPGSKWDMILVAGVRHRVLHEFFAQIESWPPRPMPPYDELEALEKTMDAIKSKVEELKRTQSEDTQKFQGAGVFFDWRLMKKIQQHTIRFGHRYCTIALAAYEHARKNRKDGAIPTRVRNCLSNAANFSFLKVYQFAGGFDNHTKELFKRINSILTELQAQQPAGGGTGGSGRGAAPGK